MSRISIPTLRKQAELSTHGVVTTYEAAALGRVVLALVEAVEAAHTLADYHKDFLGLPVLADENLDAAVEQWARLRAALARFDFGDGQ